MQCNTGTLVDHMPTLAPRTSQGRYACCQSITSFCLWPRYSRQSDGSDGAQIITKGGVTSDKHTPAAHTDKNYMHDSKDTLLGLFCLRASCPCMNLSYR